MQPAAIRVDRFGGARPRSGSRLLQNFEARAADNCRLWSGELGAWRKPSQVFGVGTNYLTFSNAFQNAAWTQNALNGVTGNATTAPDGSVTAEKLLENTANAFHFVQQFVTKPPVSDYWFGAVSVKAAERGFAWMQLTDGVSAAFFCVDLSTGALSQQTVTGAFSDASFNVVNEGSGWWRMWLTVKTASTSTLGLGVGPALNATTLSYAGTLNSGIYVDGGQIRKSNKFGPYRETLATALPNDPQTIYGFRTTWFVFDEVANLASAPLSADTVDTTYFTRASGEPRVTYTPIAEDTTGSGDLPRSSFSMGLPVPTSPPVVVASSSTGTITAASAQIASTGASTASSYTMVGVTTDGRTVRGKFHFKTNITTLVNQRATVRFVITRSGFTGEIAAMEQNLSFSPPSGSPESQDVEYTLEFDDAPPAGTYNYVATVQIVFVGGGSFTATYEHNGATMRYTQTTVTSTAHGRVVGDTVKIADVAGMEAINTGSTEVVGVPTANTFIIDIDSQGQTYTSGGVWTQVYQDEDLEEVAYVMTWLSTIGSKVLEGPPSSPSNIITRGDGQLVQLSLINTSPPVDGGSYNLSGKRIYRTNVRSDLGANYQFVAELVVGATSYNDTTRDVALGEVLPSSDWIKPPTTMQGVIELSNGVLAAFNGKDVCFSEPYQPHAWPVKYRLTAFSTVVGLVATGASIVVVTLGKPHFIHGTTPGEMEMIKIEAAQPCVSARGIVDMGYAAVYPGDDGLVSITSGAVDIVTREHFTKEEWNDLNPSSIIAAEHDGRYVAFYTKTDGTQGGFIIDPKETMAKVTFLDFGASAVWTDPKTGDLYALIDEYICKWDSADDYYDFRWHSKTFEMPTCNMAWARIQASDYPVSFDLYANQDPSNQDTLALLTSLEVNDARPFRLPADYLATLYEFELRGNGDGRVKQVDIATSIEELTRGG